MWIGVEGGRPEALNYIHVASQPLPLLAAPFSILASQFSAISRRSSPAEKVPLFAPPVLRALFMWNARSDPTRSDGTAMPCHVIPARADCCHLRICNELPDSLAARYPLDERAHMRARHARRGFINLPPLLSPHSIHRYVNILRGSVRQLLRFVLL